jgi:hypothetical protein
MPTGKKSTPGDPTIGRRMRLAICTGLTDAACRHPDDPSFLDNDCAAVGGILRSRAAFSEQVTI